MVLNVSNDDVKELKEILQNKLAEDETQKVLKIITRKSLPFSRNAFEMVFSVGLAIGIAIGMGYGYLLFREKPNDLIEFVPFSRS